MLNVRLNIEIEKKLNSYSQQHNLSKSAIVKEALVAYLEKARLDATSFELGKDLFGAAGSGHADASQNYKSKIKRKLSEKHSH